MTFALIALGLAMAAMGMYVANADPPGAPVGGFLLWRPRSCSA